jgi:hypothetical protein
MQQSICVSGANSLTVEFACVVRVVQPSRHSDEAAQLASDQVLIELQVNREVPGGPDIFSD